MARKSTSPGGGHPRARQATSEQNDPAFTESAPSAQVSANVRPLDEIFADIHRAERQSIFDIGDLLHEAKAACHARGDKWLPRIEAEFEWSKSTVENYMRAAKLRERFPQFGNLKLPKSTLYDLFDENESALPTIIDALAERATKHHLSRTEASDIIWRARLRLKWGHFPDATLAALNHLNHWEPWYDEAKAALKARKPETDEEADAIVAAIKPPEPAAEVRETTPALFDDIVDGDGDADDEDDDDDSNRIDVQRLTNERLLELLTRIDELEVENRRLAAIIRATANHKVLIEVWQRASSEERERFMREARLIPDAAPSVAPVDDGIPPFLRRTATDGGPSPSATACRTTAPPHKGD
jgi:hypothetical protein